MQGIAEKEGRETRTGHRDVRRTPLKVSGQMCLSPSSPEEGKALSGEAVSGTGLDWKMGRSQPGPNKGDGPHLPYETLFSFPQSQQIAEPPLRTWPKCEAFGRSHSPGPTGMLYFSLQTSKILGSIMGKEKISKHIILQKNITQLFSDSRKGKSISHHI